MTRASMELITGAPQLFGLRPAGKQLPSPAKCPDRGVGKNLTLAKWSRACLPQKSEHEPRKEREAGFFASGDSAPSFARFKHLSRDSYPPPRLAGKISWDTFRSLLIEFFGIYSLNTDQILQSFKALTLIGSWSSLRCFLLSCFWSWPWSYFPHKALCELRPCWEAKRGKGNSCHFDRIKLDWLKDWCMAVKSEKAQLCWMATNLVGMIRAIVANEKWEWRDLFLLQHLHLKRLTHPSPIWPKVHFHLLASSC